MSTTRSDFYYYNVSLLNSNDNSGLFQGRIRRHAYWIELEDKYCTIASTARSHYMLHGKFIYNINIFKQYQISCKEAATKLIFVSNLK